MKVYIIESIEEFHEYYHHLKRDSAVGSTPETHIVGFDVEYICNANYPESFKKCSSWVLNHDKDMACCLVQIASRDVCLIINLVKMGKFIPNKLIKIFKNDNWVKVGIGIENDLSNLSYNYNLGHCGGGIEIKNICLMAKVKNPNLENIYNHVTRSNIKKSGSMCDWSKELGQKQIEYAVKDAMMSYQIFIRIIKPSIKNLEKIFDRGDDKLLQFSIINSMEKSDKHSPTSIKIDYISRLQTYCQQKKIKLPVYTIKFDKKKDQFRCTCYFLDCETTGFGRSKQTAKYEAARMQYKQNDHIS